MNESWYTSHEQTEPVSDSWRPAPVNSAPANLPRRRRGGLIAALVILAILVLIAVSSILFGTRGGNEEAEIPLPGSEGGFADDFRDFFENYYSSYTASEECTIPTVASFPGRTIALLPAGEEELSLQTIYERCVPSVVAVTAFVDEKSDDSYFWGSGIVLTEDGYIVTNSHVIEGACRARITLWNDEEYDALLVGYDSRSDIAVLKIDAHGLIPAEFCDGEKLAVGQSVVAIGNPLGREFRSTMTEGIISGIDRDIHYNGTTLTLLQTSTPINEGNSGGPLFNLCGQVIGITNMKMSNRYSGVSIEGVGFAIPSRTVKSMADSLLAHGEVVGRPALGLTVGAIPDAAKEQYDLPSGLYVSEISPGSDAVNRGIVKGDILLTVNGEPLTDTVQLTGLIASLSVGDTLLFTVWHQAEDGTVSEYETEIALVDVNDVY